MLRMLVGAIGKIALGSFWCFAVTYGLMEEEVINMYAPDRGMQAAMGFMLIAGLALVLLGVWDVMDWRDGRVRRFHHHSSSE